MLAHRHRHLLFRLAHVADTTFASSCRFASDSTITNKTTEGPLQQESITNLHSNFLKNPQQAAQQIADVLSPAQRAVLAQALVQHKASSAKTDEKALYDELFELSDLDGEKSRLTRLEFHNAMHLYKTLHGAQSNTPPDARALRMVFVASAIPFVGFGFLDNFIMLVAGEEIDAIFGIKLGLSTLASAGLGNLVADMIGVGAANGIEQAVKKLPFIKEFKLSKHQAAMSSTKTAKAIGATFGVMIGCLLGLAPLFLGGNFFVTR